MIQFRFSFLLLFVAGIIPSYAQKVENALFWEISGKGMNKPSYLFGTYHVLTSGYLDEIPKVKAAFENADAVVVETILDSAKIQQVMMGMMMSSKNLSELISPEDYKLVDAEVESAIGADLNAMGQFKPVLITFMLTMQYNQQENKEFLDRYKGAPIDIYFASAAKGQGKPVSAFETMEEQFNILFKHDSEEKQAQQLVEFVKSKEDMRKAMKELTTLYVDQDLKGLFTMYKKYSKQFGDAAYLLDDRNVKWIEMLPGMLAGGNKFVGVGALHMAGEKSLIKLLREAGYTVKPLPLK